MSQVVNAVASGSQGIQVKKPQSLSRIVRRKLWESSEVTEEVAAKLVERYGDRVVCIALDPEPMMVRLNWVIDTYGSWKAADYWSAPQSYVVLVTVLTEREYVLYRKERLGDGDDFNWYIQTLANQRYARYTAM